MRQTLRSVNLFVGLLLLAGSCPGAEESPWKRSVEFGYSASTGNTETMRLSSKMHVSVEIKKYEFSLSGAAHYGKSKGARDLNKGFVQVKFDYLPEGVFSPFLFGQTEYDQFKELDWRAYAGVGAKYAFYKTESSDISISDAVLLEGQKFKSIDSERTFRNSLRFKLKQKIAEGSDVTFWIFHQPNFEEWEDYRIIAEAVLTTEITEVFALKFSFADNYENLVPAGTERNDTETVASLKLSF